MAPCTDVVDPSLLGELGLDVTGEKGVNSLGAAQCTWRTARLGGRELRVSLVLSGDLFVDTYRTRPLRVFRPHETSGLPAVDSTAFEGSPACVTTVGVADGQTLDVDVARGTYADERRADSCAISRRVAEEVVSTLPPL